MAIPIVASSVGYLDLSYDWQGQPSSTILNMSYGINPDSTSGNIIEYGRAKSYSASPSMLYFGYCKIQMNNYNPTISVYRGNFWEAGNSWFTSFSSEDFVILLVWLLD